MVQPGGVEPPTYRSVVCRSIQLSYGCKELCGNAAEPQILAEIGAQGKRCRGELRSPPLPIRPISGDEADGIRKSHSPLVPQSLPYSIRPVNGEEAEA